MSYVVGACMSLIERVVPPGALVKVDNKNGIKMVIPEEAPYVDLPWYWDNLLKYDFETYLFYIPSIMVKLKRSVSITNQFPFHTWFPKRGFSYKCTWHVFVHGVIIVSSRNDNIYIYILFIYSGCN